jgi:hypothetical protein
MNRKAVVPAGSSSFTGAGTIEMSLVPSSYPVNKLKIVRLIQLSAGLTLDGSYSVFFTAGRTTKYPGLPIRWIIFSAAVITEITCTPVPGG